jgi:hypothetical protein
MGWALRRPSDQRLAARLATEMVRSAAQALCSAQPPNNSLTPNMQLLALLAKHRTASFEAKQLDEARELWLPETKKKTTRRDKARRVVFGSRLKGDQSVDVSLIQRT